MRSVQPSSTRAFPPLVVGLKPTLGEARQSVSIGGAVAAVFTPAVSFVVVEVFLSTVDEIFFRGES